MIWTQQEDERLALEYPTQKKTDIVHLFPNRSYVAIGSRARHLKIKKSLRYSGKRVYEPIWSFWDNWTPDLAYVIGILAADGTLPRTQHIHGVKLTLQIKDFCLLENIKRLAGGSTWRNGTTASCTWGLHGKDVSAHLAKLGLEPMKSMRSQLPFVPANLTSHFMRGYFDGDGSVARQNVIRDGVPGQTHRFSICGANGGFVVALKTLIASQFSGRRFHEISAGLVRKHKSANMWIFQLAKRELVADIVAWMYQDCGLHLPRKKAVADEIIDWLRKRKGYGDASKVYE